MTFTEWLLFFLAVQIIHFLGTWKLYQRAGRKAWEALVPVYNGFVLMEIIKRPKWWILLLFIPIVNLLMFPIIWIETARSFGFVQRKYTILTLITFGLFAYYINYATEAPYRADRSLDPRTSLGEWVSSIAFAIIAATMVHTYFMQPYTIPSSSLEKTLLVGDYLFVSKFHYGARVPMTTVAAPMLHDTIPAIPIPFTGINLNKSFVSYTKKPQLPYMRLPGFQKIKRNDIVVFSWPADSLKTMWGDNSGEFTYKPIDKRTNYVKRCVGIPGDSLSIKNGYVYINGIKNELPDRAKLQFFYLYTSKVTIGNNTFPRFIADNERSYVFSINTKYWEDNTFKKRLKRDKINLTRIGGDSINTEFIGNISEELVDILKINISSDKRMINLTDEEVVRLRKFSNTASVEKIKYAPDIAIFPHQEALQWSQDDFGPIYIPEAGKTVSLDAKTLPFYKDIITRYEFNDLEVNDNTIYINGQEANSYTFKQDYYWMMGDNRNNSLDARYWGFVPFDHVVGKPVMIWFSWDPNATGLVAKIKSIRWDRMFTTVGGNGELVSYRYLVLALILSYIGYSVYRSRRKKKA
jgi:signal peptidase I